ncbi:hypothetical protein A3G67_03580 [Candidatus Roizmanbacteria bacterium RIFCSPLOWO2_12_FULL_40_12]|uniref:Type II secretion system protein GspG C-terminal domain-containing protein n=1 Tax=Candidatus Roizmanbacteria bacterium RIFCSPLOWO2_01_FULL_40_42 TaxID=1802066 RepID=A0A1F7J5L5_9BACT|nr:MAG: hypothetical protein A2779_03215 [Candidatus Roizmanbacteria bacterium RIFCSPHIGHO2_01_FULL_40_98]OGK28349.1 MAG: hypothetical protein A3C31_00580 [Candidatus Roizmanbacteria bacterium RIFCSPHIGHO2_02_FULL_40_53]OGK30585.1 MAG: hypothetical protein A2W49_03265 [Candidatus Roizmanbacteria bacterium RIFCSPHIGHO2_12_41_18]OGK36999.1 MAG: hypothetical protein A3E69_00840 [Candidatus Roizmanbacteria bacterium RIFCSPHIGHO2_12_FULL_40_130]OGK50905.1 MAG: hypothetical protein A3B50_01350 [Candi
MRKAFTLLELLVVIGIIAVLVSLGTFSYTTAQKKARDTKRKGDLHAIQNSLEQYYSICGFVYPVPGGSSYTSIVCTSPSMAIMPTVPSDPRATPYICSGCTNSEYSLCGTMESESPTSYCVTNQQ